MSGRACCHLCTCMDAHGRPDACMLVRWHQALIHARLWLIITLWLTACMRPGWTYCGAGGARALAPEAAYPRATAAPRVQAVSVRECAIRSACACACVRSPRPSADWLCPNRRIPAVAAAAHWSLVVVITCSCDGSIRCMHTRACAQGRICLWRMPGGERAESETAHSPPPMPGLAWCVWLVQGLSTLRD